MGWFVVGVVVGLVVGWAVPQPEWAKSIVNWVKRLFNRS